MSFPLEDDFHGQSALDEISLRRLSEAVVVCAKCAIWPHDEIPNLILLLRNTS